MHVFERIWEALLLYLRAYVREGLSATITCHTYLKGHSGPLPTNVLLTSFLAGVATQRVVYRSTQGAAMAAISTNECAWPPLSTHSLLTFPPAEWPLLDFSRPANNRTRLQTGLSPLHNAVLLDLGSSAQKLAFRGANVNGVDKVCNICFSCNLCLRPTVYPVESSEKGTSPAKLMGVQIVYAVDTYVCPSKFEIFSDTVRANAPFILERSQQYIVSWTSLPFTYLALRINGIH